MKQLRWLLFIAFLWAFGFLQGCSGEKDSSVAVSDSLRRTAIEMMRHNLANPSPWLRIHAAEYLLRSGNSEGVQEAFLAEDRLHGSEPELRIGIWRVLAQVAKTSEQKAVWTNKILSVYGNLDAVDRVHAAESLAKLGVSPLEEYPSITRNILSGENNDLKFYTYWAISYTNAAAQNDAYAYLSGLLTPDTSHQALRSLAAYALRHFNSMDADQWTSLASLALSEPHASADGIYMLSAALVQTPEDSLNTQIYVDLKQKLLNDFASYRNGALEITAALTERGNRSDLPLLISIMDAAKSGGDAGSKSMANSGISDASAAAACAIFCIGERTRVSISYLDWLVIIVYLLGMIGIGVFYYYKNKNQSDFFLGGRKMNAFSVGLSLFATFTSSISYLAYPGEMIKNGPVVFVAVLAFPITHYVVGWLIIPRLREFNVTSAYEILEIKLGLSVRLLASCFFLILRLLWMATIIYVTVDIVLLSVFHMSPGYAFPVSVGLMVITILYASIGGLKAVVITDAVQAFMLLGGALLVVVLVSLYFGSFTSWLPDHWLSQWGEMKFQIDARDRSSIGGAIIMTFVWYVASSAGDQMSVQRFLATKSTKTARRTFGISLITTVISMGLLGLVGLALMAYFKANPQFLAGRNIGAQADTLFPKYMVVGLPPGGSGLLLAALLAAAMSSLSAGLNSCASVITEDIIKRFKPAGKKSNFGLRKVQILSFLIGMVTLILSLIIPYVSGNLYDLTTKVVNLLVSPLFVLFFMALYIPFATARGTFLGGVISTLVAIATAFFGFLNINVFFIITVSLIAGILAGIVFSYIDYKLLGNQEIAARRQQF